MWTRHCSKNNRLKARLSVENIGQDKLLQDKTRNDKIRKDKEYIGKRLKYNMYKILISGYYGFANIGDESILKAVTDGLKDRFCDTKNECDDIEITVLSHDPHSTAMKYGVRACERKSIFVIIRELLRCDLLISGGGSLLQDVTSKKSILYYLFIMWLAKLFGKDYLIYSQGIGPINSNFNKRLTEKILSKAAGIVVRDENSKEFLAEIGIDPSKVVVTADPVLRIKKVDLSLGREILLAEGCKFDLSQVVGFAVKERKLTSGFVDELTEAIAWLIRERDFKVVLIPFHFSEDMALIEELATRLSEMGLSDSICTIKQKYLTNEMLSIIGNMGILVGVRLHSLIHAAIMGVPMIGISYDPKVNSFMNSIGLKAMCSIYDFKSEFFAEEFDKTCKNKDLMLKRIDENINILREKLDTNEEMIANLMKNKRQ